MISKGYEKYGLRHGAILANYETRSNPVLFGCTHLPAINLDKRFVTFTAYCYAPSKTFNLAGLKASTIAALNPGIQKELAAQFEKTCLP